MDKTLSLLADAIANQSFFAFTVIITGGLIFNLKNILEFIDSRKKIKIQLIEDSLKTSHINGNTRAHLESAIENEYFKVITGIDTEKNLREAMIQAHQDLGEVNFKVFKSAIQHLNSKAGVLEVNINGFSKLGLIYNAVIGILCILLGLSVYWFPLSGADIAVSQKLSLAAVSLFLLGLGILMLLQTFPVLSAFTIKKKLKLIGEADESSNNEITDTNEAA